MAITKEQVEEFRSGLIGKYVTDAFGIPGKISRASILKGWQLEELSSIPFMHSTYPSTMIVNAEMCRDVEGKEGMYRGEFYLFRGIQSEDDIQIKSPDGVILKKSRIRWHTCFADSFAGFGFDYIDNEPVWKIGERLDPEYVNEFIIVPETPVRAKAIERAETIRTLTRGSQDATQALVALKQYRHLIEKLPVNATLILDSLSVSENLLEVTKDQLITEIKRLKSDDT